jgi:hypothetical protein
MISYIEADRRTRALGPLRSALSSGAARILIPGCVATIAIGAGLASAVSSPEPPQARGDGAGSIVSAPALTAKTTQAAEPTYMRLAQEGERSFVVQSISGESAGAIPLNIKLVGKHDDQYRFVMVRGLPPTFKMSAGFRTKDAWLVSVLDFNGLQLLPDDNFVGDLSLQFLLFRGKDTAPVEQTVVVRILPQKAQEAAARDNVPTNATPTAPIAPLPGTIASTKPKAAASPRSEQVAAIPVEPEKPAAQPSPRRSVSAAEEEYEMQRARELIENADIAAARLIYEAMAFKGSAQAAFAMGQTFDPEFLRNFTVGGLKPDLARAKTWYKKAAELGSSEAQNRLAALQ